MNIIDVTDVGYRLSINNKSKETGDSDVGNTMKSIEKYKYKVENKERTSYTLPHNEKYLFASLFEKLYDLESKDKIQFNVKNATLEDVYLK